MKFSLSWLQEWVDVGADSDELIERLTMAGLEVDGSAPVARAFSGIIVAEVTSVEAHPDADKLSLCQVNTGSETFQVVCGAPNVKAGMKAPFANLGAELYSDDSDKPFKIKKAKLRGVESQGMLCSAQELGLEDKSTGLLLLPADAPLGQNIRDYLHLDDLCIELDLTPNRGDCLSLLGIAREVGVLTRQEIRQPAMGSVQATISDEFPVSVTSTKGCPRYLGRVVKGVNLDASTPLWMQEKLRRSGLRSIDPIVDVTNYVLLELGQPMHAFDLAKLSGGIDVRMADSGEKLTLLDGKEVTLNDDILVITDADKAVAMAGIMGGLDCSVTADTSDVFLECAFFAPLAIAGKARSFGMHTDASHRYERGVDYRLQHRAMERATELLLAVAGGEAGPITEALGEMPEELRVELRLANVPRLLGVEIPRDEITDIFERLGMKVVAQDEKQITVSVPTFRFDIEIEADLIEELARIYGYNNVPSTGGLDQARLGRLTESRLPLQRLRGALVDLGYQEAITYSFIDPKLAELMQWGGAEKDKAVLLENPISEDMSVMRTSLLPGLVSTLRYNVNRQQERLRLFECGQVFRNEAGAISHEERIAGLAYGLKNPENWLENKELNNFYDVKGDVEFLLEKGGKSGKFEFQPVDELPYHPGRCARISVAASGELVGHVGSLHPAIQRQLGIAAEVYLFELAQRPLLAAHVPQVAVLSRQPEVSRDLAIVVHEDVLAADILALVRQTAGDHLTDLKLFDVYQGDAVEKNAKSLALGLTWQHPSRTLSEEEINATIGRCINALQEQFNANLRK